MVGVFRRGAVESVEAPTGKGLRAGEPPMLIEHRFAPRFLVFIERSGESGLWFADRIGLGHERRLNTVAHHTERLMRIGRRMSLQVARPTTGVRPDVDWNWHYYFLAREVVERGTSYRTP